ncbi:hypothetical protein OSTOST_08152 [Ostertagia ostertagi]
MKCTIYHEPIFEAWVGRFTGEAPFGEAALILGPVISDSRASLKIGVAEHFRPNKSTERMSRGLLSPNMRQPLRSQSFKHRPRPLIEVKKTTIEDVPNERRRSTPTISRRSSLVHRRVVAEPRTDVWPEPKPALEFDEKFLKLPSSDEYKRRVVAEPRTDVWPEPKPALEFDEKIPKAAIF